MGTNNNDSHTKTPDQGESPEVFYIAKHSLRNYIQAQSDPRVLLIQLRGLHKNRDFESCKELVDITIEEQHALGDHGDFALVRAQVAFEEENMEDMKAWVQQALNAPIPSSETQEFLKLSRGVRDLKDGLYDQGLATLDEVKSESSWAYCYAQYLIGRHYLFKTQESLLAIEHFEECLRYHSNFTMAWAAMGFAYSKINDPANSQKAFSKCLEIEKRPEMRSFYRQHLAS